MNLQASGAQLESVYSSVKALFAKGGQSVWSLLNYDLVENILTPRRRVFIALDKDSLAVVYGIRSFGKSSIKVCRRYAYERKPQENVSRKYIYQDGQLPKPEVLASTLEFFIGEFEAEHAKVVLSIPKAWTIYRTVEFPVAVLENIDNVIFYELDRLVSLTPENAYYDFKIVHQTEETLKVSIAAARKDLIDNYIRLIEEKGLIVEKITTSLSVAGSLLNHLYGKNCFLLVDVYKDEYEVSAIKEGAVFFAHKQKVVAGPSPESTQAMIDDVKTLQGDLNALGYNAQIVISSDADDAGKELTALPAEMMHRSNVAVRLTGQMYESDSLSAAGCLELMSADSESFNLLSRSNSNQTAKTHFVSIRLAIAAAVLGILSIFAPFALEKAKLFEIESRINALREEYRQIEPMKNELDDILFQVRTINEFKNAKPPRILLLAELANILPASHWVSRMTVTDDLVELTVQSRDPNIDISPLLEKSPYFKNVSQADQPYVEVEEGQGAELQENQFAANAIVVQMEIENHPEESEQGGR